MWVAVHAAAQALLRRHRLGGCCSSGHRLFASSVSQQAAMLPAHRQQQPGKGMMNASTCLFRPQQAATATFSRAVQCCAAAAGARSRKAHHAAVRTTQRQLHTELHNLQHLCSELASQLDAPLVIQEVAAPAAAELGMHTQQDHQQQQQQQEHAGQGAASEHQQQQQRQQQRRYLEHLQQHILPTEVLLIAIDPDTNGAIAVVNSQLHWSLTDGSSNVNSGGHVQKSSRSGNGSKKDSSSGSTAEVPQLQAHMGLPAAVSVYDMPVQTIVTQSKTSTGKHRVRRRLDILQSMAIIRQVLQDATAATAEQATAAAGGHTAATVSSSNGSSSSSSNGSSNGSTGNGSGGGRILLRAVVEVASMLPTNGRLATLNQGYSVGAWTALLAAHGFDVTTVHVLSWKKDLGLLKRNKDSSRQLAKVLFQQAGVPQDKLLRTKNTHGRAESLLLAAWGLGWSAQQGSSEGPTQGPLRATVHMDGGQHSLPMPQQHQAPQQLLLLPHPDATAAAAGATTSDDESSSQLLCMPSGMSALAGAGAMFGVVDRAHLAQHLQPLLSAQHTQQQQQQEPCRILDVSAQMAAAVAAVEAKAAAKQAEKEARTAARKAAVQERAAARKAEVQERAAARKADAEQRAAAKAAAAAQRAAAKAAEKAAKAAAAVEGRAPAKAAEKAAAAVEGRAAAGSRRRVRPRSSSPSKAADDS